MAVSCSLPLFVAYLEKLLSDEKIRILLCHVCGSIEEIPWYEGDPANDTLLEYKVSTHRFPNGDPHIGDLAAIKKKDWDHKASREQIITELNAGRGGDAGMGQPFRDLRMSFQQEAMTCWKAHNRTTNCGDYHRENKRLVPDTAAERKDLGLSPKDRPNTWLCDFCPVQSIVDRSKNK